MTAWRIAAAAAAVVVLWLGALVAWLGAVAGTCTMADADNLMLGVPALALFALGLALARVARPSPWFLYFPLLPAALPWGVAAWTGLRLAAGILLAGASACEVLHGLPFEPSGEEGFYVALWLLVAVVPPLGLAAVLRRGQA